MNKQDQQNIHEQCSHKLTDSINREYAYIRHTARLTSHSVHGKKETQE